MDSGKLSYHCFGLDRVSRRDLLKGGTALAVTSALARCVPSAWAQSSGTILAYVGSYTPNGQGIGRFQVDPSTGNLISLGVTTANNNPSWLAFHPTNRFLYVVNEISNFNGTTSGSVTGYAINQTTGDLTFLNAVSSQGSGPAHCSVDPTGRFVLVANYGGGNVAVLPIQTNGFLGNATDVKDDNSACSPQLCAVGPTHAQNAPPGSFAISGHDAPHAHMIQTDPSGKFVLVNDLGLDRILIWAFDNVAGKLSNPTTVSVSPGAGPRHSAFHPNGGWLYVLNEEASTITFMTFDPSTGTLSPVEEISALPSNFVGTNFTSEIRISQDGNFLYVANRLHDTIGIFQIRPSGQLEHRGQVWTRGDYPRSFNIDPTGCYLYSCNHRGDSITIYSIRNGGDTLAFTKQYVAVGSPACIVFFTIP